MKKLICKLFNLVPKNELLIVESNLRKCLYDKKESIKKLKFESKNNYNRSNKHYMRIRRAILYMHENNNSNITKKHYKNIIDILDGVDNDGIIKKGK